MPPLKILAPFRGVAGWAGARDGRPRGARRARRARKARIANLGMEVGEEPVAGGGEWIFSKSRHGVTGRVLDVVAVELEVDVGEESQGPRQTRNIVAGSVDSENIIYRYESEHDARQFSGKCMTTNRPSKQETLDDTPGAQSPKPCEEDVFQTFVLDVVVLQVECGDRAVRALQRRGEVGAPFGAENVVPQVECVDLAVLDLQGRGEVGAPLGADVVVGLSIASAVVPHTPPSNLKMNAF